MGEREVQNVHDEDLYSTLALVYMQVMFREVESLDLYHVDERVSESISGPW